MTVIAIMTWFNYSHIYMREEHLSYSNNDMIQVQSHTYEGVTGPLHIDIVLWIMQIKQLLKYEPLNVELKSMLTISLLAGYALVPGSSFFVSVGAYRLSEKWCVHRHRKQYLSFGYSFVTGKSIIIILPNCMWNYNA
jgi:hypothetical protein